MQDRFSKWLEMRPLRQATTSHILRSLTEAVILRHGCSAEILSDNGTPLKTEKLTGPLRALNIRYRFTPAYASQCNPVERTIKTIKTMISQYVGRRHKTWDDHLAELQFAYNTSDHDATGYSPAFLNHGRELRLPSEPERRGPPIPPIELQRRLHEAYELVKINLARAFQRQKRHYNLRQRDWRPKIGDRVWKREHPLTNKANAFNAKLALKFIGSLEVRRITSPVIVDLRAPNGR